MGCRHSKDNGGYHGYIGLEMVGMLILKYGDCYATHPQNSGCST